MDTLGFLWNQVLIDPMTNALIVLSNVFLGSFGLAIIIFTVVMRAITFPLTLQQLRSSRAMSAIRAEDAGDTEEVQGPEAPLGRDDEDCTERRE